MRPNLLFTTKKALRQSHKTCSSALKSLQIEQFPHKFVMRYVIAGFPDLICQLVCILAGGRHPHCAGPVEIEVR